MRGPAGPAYGDRGADLTLDFDQPHKSRSMIGGTYGCPPGANERAFLAGSFTGWAIVEVAVFTVHPRPGKKAGEEEEEMEIVDFSQP
ncbi:hypothetical protein T484DRAFT_1776160 [Baffinella frigidus]|nr:hypothetical protein T484DRAFT_1776160 [Cryptophyta sp. CCMP2293]